jgi:hypothetical protein
MSLKKNLLHHLPVEQGWKQLFLILKLTQLLMQLKRVGLFKVKYLYVIFQNLTIFEINNNDV